MEAKMPGSASIAALLSELDRRGPAGFAIALHIRFATPTYLFQSYARRWMDHYAASGLVVHDPTVAWGLNNIGHIRWSELEASDGHGVLDQAKDYGLMNGVTIAMLASGSRTIASFARADRDYDDGEIADLRSLLAELHEATLGQADLSDADKMALRRLAIRLTH